MAGEYPNPSNFDSASVCPKERFYPMGRTIDFRSAEGVHEIQLFHDSRFQNDSEPFGTITHAFLDDGSSFFLLKDEINENRSGVATLSCREEADILTFTGQDAAGQELTASFTVTTTQMKNGNNEFYNNISLKQTFRHGDLTHFFAGEDHKRLVGIYRAAKFIRENKPHYNFMSLLGLLTPFKPSPMLAPGKNWPDVVIKR